MRGLLELADFVFGIRPRQLGSDVLPDEPLSASGYLKDRVL